MKLRTSSCCGTTIPIMPLSLGVMSVAVRILQCLMGYVVPQQLEVRHLLTPGIVVSTLRCGRSNPGSNPGHGIVMRPWQPRTCPKRRKKSGVGAKGIPSTFAVTPFASSRQRAGKLQPLFLELQGLHGKPGSHILQRSMGSLHRPRLNFNTLWLPLFPLQRVSFNLPGSLGRSHLGGRGVAHFLWGAPQIKRWLRILLKQPVRVSSHMV